MDFENLNFQIASDNQFSNGDGLLELLRRINQEMIILSARQIQIQPLQATSGESA